MKRAFYILSVCLFLFNCEESAVTGSDDVMVLDGAEFVIDTTYVFGDEFRASGTISNTGRSTYTPIWYVEASFFSDAGQNFKFGGNNDWFNFSLSPGQSTAWEINYSNSQYPASEYPNFTIGEFRAYKESGSSD
jgi:hypothetical protein